MKHISPCFVLHCQYLSSTGWKATPAETCDTVIVRARIVARLEEKKLSRWWLKGPCVLRGLFALLRWWGGGQENHVSMLGYHQTNFVLYLRHVLKSPQCSTGVSSLFNTALLFVCLFSSTCFFSKGACNPSASHFVCLVEDFGALPSLIHILKTWNSSKRYKRGT